MRFVDVAFDTSVLATPTVRRFFMAAWELQGIPVPVLPRVARELYGVMADNERGYWVRVLAGDARRLGITHDASQRGRILNGVAEAMRQWVRDTLDAEQEQGWPSALKPVRMSDGDLARALEIAEAIPPNCFKGPSKNEHYGDREIIGQAAVGRYGILALDNRSSIRRASVNIWLREQAGVNDDLLRDPDDTMHLLHASGDSRRTDFDMLRAVLLACLPDELRGVDRENEIVTGFLSRLAKSGLVDSVAGMEKAWGTIEGRELATAIRERHLSGSLARATERSRVQAAREAARHGGWRGGR